MTLLITLIAAVISTLVWSMNMKVRKLKIGTLVLAFWSASLMWLVDSVVEYIEVGAVFFNPKPSQMLNDTFLGLSVVVIGLAVWTVYVAAKSCKVEITNKIS